MSLSGNSRARPDVTCADGMFIDDLPISPSYDCFIVGSGPAGMSCALALAAARRRVLILESAAPRPPRRPRSRLRPLRGRVLERALVPRPWRHVARLGRLVRPTRDIDLDNPAVGAAWPIASAELVPYWKRPPQSSTATPNHRVEKPFVPGSCIGRCRPGRHPVRQKYRAGSRPAAASTSRSADPSSDSRPTRRGHWSRSIEYVDHLLGPAPAVDAGSRPVGGRGGRRRWATRSCCCSRARTAPCRSATRAAWSGSF